MSETAPPYGAVRHGHPAGRSVDGPADPGPDLRQRAADALAAYILKQESDEAARWLQNATEDERQLIALLRAAFPDEPFSWADLTVRPDWTFYHSRQYGGLTWRRYGTRLRVLLATCERCGTDTWSDGILMAADAPKRWVDLGAALAAPVQPCGCAADNGAEATP